MGGIIYKNNGSYYATEPIIGEPDGVDLGGIIMFAVADYHCHVLDDHEDFFSDDDLFGNIYNNINGYLINQTGVMYKNDIKNNKITNLSTGNFEQKIIVPSTDDINFYFEWVLKQNIWGIEF